MKSVATYASSLVLAEEAALRNQLLPRGHGSAGCLLEKADTQVGHHPAECRGQSNRVYKWLQRRLPVLGWALNYNARMDLASDLIGGTTLGLICLAQTLAHSYIATTHDTQGPYTAFVPTIIYALFGTSPHASVSSGAIAAILIADQLRAWPIKEDRTQLASLMALVSGCSLMLMGSCNLAFAVRFLSQPTLSGFTSGGAILIMTGQMKNLLGLRRFPHTDGLADTVREVYIRIEDVNLFAVAFSLSMIALLEIFNRLKAYSKKKLKQHDVDNRLYHGLKRFSEMKEICVVICGVLFGYLTTTRSPDMTLIPVVGHIPSGLPPYRPPWDILAFARIAEHPAEHVSKIKHFVVGGVLVALTSFLTTYATAKKVALQRGYRLDASQEMFALGAAGTVGSFFGAFCPSGSLSRTGLSAECGVKTQLAGLFAAGVIGFGITCLTPALGYLPKSAIASIIVKSSYNLLDLDTPKSLAKFWRPKPEGGLKRDLVTWCTAFVCTLTLGVVWGIGLAVLFSVGMIVYDATVPQAVMLGQVQTRGRKWRDVDAWPEARTFRGILVFEFRGPLFFASAEFFQEELERHRVKAESRDDHPLSIVVISLESVHYLDSTAIGILEDVLTQWQKIGISCIISGAQNQVRLLIEEKLVHIRKGAGLPSLLDQSAFMITVGDAVEQARQRFAARRGHKCGWARMQSW